MLGKLVSEQLGSYFLEHKFVGTEPKDFGSV